jgi:hypothetical protein
LQLATHNQGNASSSEISLDFTYSEKGRLGLREGHVRGEGELVGEGDMTEYDGAREEGGRARALHLRGCVFLQSGLPFTGPPRARDAASLSGALEAAVCRADLPPYERVFAWYRLTRVWTGIRWSDTRSIPRESVEYDADTGLKMCVTATETTGSRPTSKSRRW